jgi:hypothetical protein
VVATEAVEEKVLESQRRRHPWDARLPLPQSETVEAADRSSRTVGGGLTLRWLDQLVSESFWLRLYVGVGLGEAVREGIMAATESHDKLVGRVFILNTPRTYCFVCVFAKFYPS